MEKDNSHVMTRRNVVKIIGSAAIVSAFPVPGFTSFSEEETERQIYYAYRSFWPELEMTGTFKKMGVNTRCFFASNTINSIGFEYCKYPLIWLGRKKYDFSAYDKQVDDLLSANPEAKFLCMIDLNTPYWLTRKFAYDSFDAISHAASDKEWISITTEWMLDFIDYSEKKYGDRISAYILSGGGTSEWYEYDRGRSSRVKNNAWREWSKKKGYKLYNDVPAEGVLNIASHENIIYDPVTESEKIHYWQFHNEVISDAILHFTKIARNAISKDKEVGVFFGYYMVSDNKLVSFGHLDYERVFSSPDIDFFISPGTYKDRMIGGGSGPQLVDGTLSRYGKRYLHEIDHRTHCITTETWKTQDDDNAGNTREAAFALIKHASLWWFDMWGGFYQKEETQKLIKRLKEVSDLYINDRSSSVAETLLIADPQSAYYINEKMPHASAMSYQFRDKLNRTGAPFDLYSFNDIPVIDLKRYKAVFLPATLLLTPEREEMLRKYLLNGKRTVIWVYAPGICDGKTLDVNRVKTLTGTGYGTTGPVTVDMKEWRSVYVYEYATMTPAVIKEILRNAGVHMFTNDENPVYANERLIAIHYKEGGQKTVFLPRKYKQVIDVMDGKTVGRNSSRFTYVFATPGTSIFEIIS
jgi:hypothetical protein